jgi:uncharacterized phage protein gp47/JayE
MASFNTQTFSTLVSNWVASVEATAAGLADFTIGSILRAMAEADGQVVLWLQGLILQLLVTTRAATCSGSDLDSWIADYCTTPTTVYFARLPAVAAQGVVTFARQTPTLQAVVPVGSTVQSQDGTQTFTVYADPTNPAYNAGLGGFVLAPGAASVNVSVRALTPGSAGNALAGAVSVITSGIAGIDTVTNAAPFASGQDAELDPPLRARFVNFVNSLSRGTPLSLKAAIQAVQLGAVCTVVENQTYAGATQYGYGYVVVDDGSGAPATSFLSACAAAVEAVRGLSIQVGVFAPVVLTANWGMTLSVAAGYSKPSVAASVQTAVSTYIAALGLGNALNLTRLSQIAYDASPGVANVSGVTVNGGASDLAASPKQVIKPGTATVTTP